MDSILHTTVNILKEQTFFVFKNLFHLHVPSTFFDWFLSEIGKTYFNLFTTEFFVLLREFSSQLCTFNAVQFFQLQQSKQL